MQSTEVLLENIDEELQSEPIQLISSLYKVHGVQKALKRSHEFQLYDSAAYFLERINHPFVMLEHNVQFEVFQ